MDDREAVCLAVDSLPGLPHGLCERHALTGHEVATASSYRQLLRDVHGWDDDSFHDAQTESRRAFTVLYKDTCLELHGFVEALVVHRRGRFVVFVMVFTVLVLVVLVFRLSGCRRSLSEVNTAVVGEEHETPDAFVLWGLWLHDGGVRHSFSNSHCDHEEV